MFVVTTQTNLSWLLWGLIIIRNILYSLYIYLKQLKFRTVSKLYDMVYLRFYTFWVFPACVFYKFKAWKYFLGVKAAFKCLMSTEISYSFTSIDVSWTTIFFYNYAFNSVINVQFLSSYEFFCSFFSFICRLLDIGCSDEMFFRIFFNITWLSL